jgi:hypothetical protein
VGCFAAAALLVAGCSLSSDGTPASSSSTSSSDAIRTTTVPTTITPATTTTTTTTRVTTTVGTTAASEFGRDAELIMDLYVGWSEAVRVGRSEIEDYLDAHLYPELPRCVAGEKTLPLYTAKRETIHRADEWAISWGPLNGVHPDGRVYEVQLAELDSPSHVTILHGVAYVFWNCRGSTSSATTTAPGTRYSVEEPSYAPPPLPGSDGAAGSGCNPGAAELPDGIWFVFIEEATVDHVSFDLACIWPDRAMDDGFISNTSNRIRTATVHSNAAAYQVIAAESIDWNPMLYRDWLVAPQDEELCSWPCNAAWLYVNDGNVTKLVQLFFP